MKLSVDTLTLTATPIPRTLQFSLLGARDLSIISTPPPNRIPVQTEIILFDETEIRSIINYELDRGGQIFFLHNKVHELQGVYDILHRLVPDMKICVAHGQMGAEELRAKNPEVVKGIKFRRNYGKSPALYCGFAKAQGDVVITMDADLQDSPDEIPALYKMIKEDAI